MAADWTEALLRKALQRFMDARPSLTINAWCKEAGVAESTLRNFFKGEKSHTLTYKVLMKLARAQKMTVAVMLGDAPSWTETQSAAAEIAGKLPPEEAKQWLHWGRVMLGEEPNNPRPLSLRPRARDSA